jgi:hypothetical protein
MLALGLATLAGCASPTVITLNDGREIQAVDTPKYNEASGFYELNSLTANAPASTKIRFAPLKTCKPQLLEQGPPRAGLVVSGDYQSRVIRLRKLRSSALTGSMKRTPWASSFKGWRSRPRRP